MRLNQNSIFRLIPGRSSVQVTCGKNAYTLSAQVDLISPFCHHVPPKTNFGLNMNLNKIFTDVERGFNIVDSIPVVAIFTSPIRVVAAKVQMLLSGIIALIGFAAQVSGLQEKKWKIVTQQGGDLFLHGALNLVRGLGELFLAYTVIGSLALFVYQSVSVKQFAPIVSYDNMGEIWEKEIDVAGIVNCIKESFLENQPQPDSKE